MVLSVYCKQQIVQLYFGRRISYGNVAKESFLLLSLVRRSSGASDIFLPSEIESNSYNMATRVLADLSPEGDELAKRSRGHVITSLLQFKRTSA